MGETTPITLANPSIHTPLQNGRTVWRNQGPTAGRRVTAGNFPYRCRRGDGHGHVKRTRTISRTLPQTRDEMADDRVPALWCHPHRRLLSGGGTCHRLHQQRTRPRSRCLPHHERLDRVRCIRRLHSSRSTRPRWQKGIARERGSALDGSVPKFLVLLSTASSYWRWAYP